MAKVRHLYIHIPFCNTLCKYCDFVRLINQTTEIKKQYVKKIIQELKKKYSYKQFQTIYIGGGTPNCLDDALLSELLQEVSKYVHNRQDCEFTIECNPELINCSQVEILKNYGVNRISLGAQTINERILAQMNRHHTWNDVTKAIKLLRNAQINNISLDFIYGFNGLTDNDIKKTIKYIVQTKIPHVSWYALEVKNNSVLNKEKYRIDDTKIDHQLELVINGMSKLHYQRYEVSSWAKHDNDESVHNKSYWLSEEWAAVGFGACGFENQTYYENRGSLLSYRVVKQKLNKRDYYFQILMMGLRLKAGLDLNKERYRLAYRYFSNKLKGVKIINKFLIAENINLLDNILIELL